MVTIYTARPFLVGLRDCSIVEPQLASIETRELAALLLVRSMIRAIGACALSARVVYVDLTVEIFGFMLVEVCWNRGHS